MTQHGFISGLPAYTLPCLEPCTALPSTALPCVALPCLASPCLPLAYLTSPRLAFPYSLSSVPFCTTNQKKAGRASNRSLFRGVGSKSNSRQTAGGKQSRGRLVLSRLLTKKTGLLLAIFAVAIAARFVSTRIPTMTEVSAHALPLGLA